MGEVLHNIMSLCCLMRRTHVTHIVKMVAHVFPLDCASALQNGLEIPMCKLEVAIVRSQLY